LLQLRMWRRKPEVCASVAKWIAFQTVHQRATSPA
jgi:hypothetical protein